MIFKPHIPRDSTVPALNFLRIHKLFPTSEDRPKRMTDLPIEIDVKSVKSMLDSGDNFLLLDCRQPQEHQTAKIDGAMLIPMGEIPDRLSEIESFKTTKIVVHCHLGGRSLRVTEWLRSNGFEQTQNMTGGITAWSQDVDPSVPQY